MTKIEQVKTPKIKSAVGGYGRVRVKGLEKRKIDVRNTCILILLFTLENNN